MFNIIARNTLVALGTIAAATLTIVGTAHAETRQAQVRVADLDLSSAQGSAMLQSRIARAANRVCGVNDERGLQAQAAAISCRKAAIAGTAEKVAALSAAHGQRFAQNMVATARTAR